LVKIAPNTIKTCPIILDNRRKKRTEMHTWQMAIN